MKQAFVHKSFRKDSLEKIQIANQIIAQYLAAGLQLTLRQLYYQFVAHYDLPNTEKSYKNLGKLISDGRLAGLIDWNAIEDRGRVADIPRQWNSIGELAEVAMNQFRLPRWEGQKNYVELWVEKQALAGVLEPIAEEHHVTLMVNKGYSSQSAMYSAAKRIERERKGVDPYGNRHPVFILYIGDHDPSGEDMVRDIEDRLVLFGVRRLEVRKVALTMEQIEEYQPPPNPAKWTDSRAQAYIDKHGDESWEVDSLDPSTLVQLITEQFDELLDRDLMAEVVSREDEQKEKLQAFINENDLE